MAKSITETVLKRVSKEAGVEFDSLEDLVASMTEFTVVVDRKTDTVVTIKA